jgi:site-specific DNA-methyltransferase (adenine-specific)
MSDIKLLNGDCIEILPTLPDKSIDCVICDPPYEMTDAKWDSLIPFDFMWKELTRVIKPKGAIVLHCSQPFTSILLMSNQKQFKHEWIWEKHQGTNPMAAKHAPMKCHESVLVFCDGSPNYYPQMEKGTPYGGFKGEKGIGEIYGDNLKSEHRDNPEGSRYPRSVQYFQGDKGLHPTQKPVALMEYLVKTYSKENDVVLDFTMGSGTTGLACFNTGRNFIGIEKEKVYYDIAEKRIEEAKKNKKEIERKSNGLKRFVK